MAAPSPSSVVFGTIASATVFATTPWRSCWSCLLGLPRRLEPVNPWEAARSAAPRRNAGARVSSSPRTRCVHADPRPASRSCCCCCGSGASRYSSGSSPATSASSRQRFAPFRTGRWAPDNRRPSTALRRAQRVDGLLRAIAVVVFGIGVARLVLRDSPVTECTSATESHNSCVLQP